MYPIFHDIFFFHFQFNEFLLRNLKNKIHKFRDILTWLYLLFFFIKLNSIKFNLIKKNYKES